MNDQFASAMGRALEQTRAGKVQEATRVIQAALAGADVGPSSEGCPSQPLSRRPRDPLGKVIARLAHGKQGRVFPAWPRGAAHGARPAIADGALYLSRRHDSEFGSRDFRLFVPSTGTRDLRGAVVMLHGCTQSADDFAIGTRMNDHAERAGLLVVYPEQARSENPMACWNWFRPGDQSVVAGEPALLADLTRTVLSEFCIENRRAFAAGLSAGGAMAAILGKTHPDLFSAVGVHSGLAPGSAHDVASAYAAMRGEGTEQLPGAPVRTILFHGSADATVHPRNAESVLRAALGNATTVEVEHHAQPHGAGRSASCVLHRDISGRTLAESWTINGAGHAWSGGAPAGSYTDPSGPDASAEMVRFFLAVAQEDRS